MPALIYEAPNPVTPARRRAALRSTLALSSLAAERGRLQTAEELARTAAAVRSTLPTAVALPSARGIALTDHAVVRWLERVGGANRAAAEASLLEMVAAGRRQPRPPRRFRRARQEPGQTFVAWADRPGVLLVIRGRAVVTVLTMGDVESRARTLDLL